MALERAPELSPDLCDGRSNRGYQRGVYRWDWAGGRADLERALRLFSGDADAWRRYGALLENLGRKEEAVQAMERAVRLDPLDGVSASALG